MRRYRTVAVVLGLAMAGLVLPSGCARPAAGPKKIVIGLALPALSHPFFVYVKQGALEEARTLDVEVLACEADDKPDRQMAIVEDFVAQRVDGVLLAPISAEALVPAAESLNAAGIPLATVDRQLNGGDVLVHVGADNVEGGRVAARYLIDKLGGKGGVIQLEGTPGASPAIDRKRGFEEVLATSELKLVASQTAEFYRAKGQSVMENLLQTGAQFQAVFAANDEMILGAIEALEARNVDLSRVVTIGYDAIPDAVDSIRQHRLTASIEQFPGEQGRSALRLLVEKIRSGQSPPSKLVRITPIVIDGSNLDRTERKGQGLGIGD